MRHVFVVVDQYCLFVQGTKHIRSLTLAGSKRKFCAEEFEKMERLHYLVVDGCEVSGDFKRFPKRLRYLQWRAMPYSQIPTTLDVSSLSMLDLSKSDKLVNLWSNSKLPMQVCRQVVKRWSTINIEKFSIHVCLIDDMESYA